LGSGCKAYSLIAGVIDAVETLQEGVSVDEVKAFAGVCTNLVDIVNIWDRANKNPTKNSRH